MTIKTSEQERQLIYELHQQGATYAELAERFGVSLMCARYWCRRCRNGQCNQKRKAHQKFGLLGHFHTLVRYAILRLRLEHPRWGPNRIRERLKKRPALLGYRLPSEAQIGRYLHQWQRFWRKPAKKPAHPPKGLPTRVHQCWQIDFKVQIRLKSGQLVNLFTVRDPFGEVTIGANVRLTKGRARIKMEEVRAVLRLCFDDWGTLPEEVQTDGESTLVSPHKNDFPSIFTLWLVGLGIQHRVIKVVTQNAEVERCHRTVCDYAMIGNEDLLPEELQQSLDQALYELNYELPSRAQGCGGKPPVLAHPELLQHPRPFQASLELSLFDLQRVDHFLASFKWVHRVGSTGQVSIGPNRVRYSVSRNYVGQDVEVRFEPQDRHLVFSRLGQSEQIIRRCPVKGLDVADLTGFDIWPVGMGYQQLPLPYFFDTTRGI
jgi:transposase